MLERYKHKDNFDLNHAEADKNTPQKPSSGKIVKGISPRGTTPNKIVAANNNASNSKHLSNFQSFAGNSTVKELVPVSQTAKEMNNLRQEAKDFFS